MHLVTFAREAGEHDSGERMRRLGRRRLERRERNGLESTGDGRQLAELRAARGATVEVRAQPDLLGGIDPTERGGAEGAAPVAARVSHHCSNPALRARAALP